MANVRQMAELYLRGSLANITMANLTPAERAFVEERVDFISKHPEMKRHLERLGRELGNTIKGDYKDQKGGKNGEGAAVLEEFHIAIWRGVVDLCFHRKYTFKCRACGSSHWFTKRAKPKPIDRVEKPCPNCKMLAIDDPGDVPGLESGQVMSEEQFKTCYADMPDGWRAPTTKSTIDWIPGPKKYDDPSRIFNDPKQLSKFFGEFVQNQFRQQINENKRKEHRKEKKRIHGRADEVILAELLSLCARMGINHSYCKRTEPRDGKHTILMFGLLTPPEFTAEFAQIKNRADQYGVVIEIDTKWIAVVVNYDAPTAKAFIVSPEHVNVLDNFLSVGDDQDSGHTIANIDYRTVEGQRMDLENHVASVENHESMVAVRDALPDGHCRDVFDILSQQGQIYLDFSEQYGDQEARINHIAEFLEITPRAVNFHKRTIKLQCLANAMVPSAK
jgi:ribosomal protein L33